MFLCDSLGNFICYSHYYYIFENVTEGFQSAVLISGNVHIPCSAFTAEVLLGSSFGCVVTCRVGSASGGVPEAQVCV